MIKGVTPCQSLMPSALPGSHAAIVSVIKAGTKAVVGPTPDEVRVTCDANENTHRKFPRQSESWSQSPSPARWPKSSLDLTHRHH